MTLTREQFVALVEDAKKREAVIPIIHEGKEVGKLDAKKLWVEGDTLKADWPNTLGLRITGFDWMDGGIVELRADTLPNGEEKEVEPPEPPKEIDRRFEAACRVWATAAGTLLNSSIQGQAGYVVLISPNDGGGLSFSTNLEPGQVAEELKKAAETFEAEARRSKTGLWTPDQGGA